MIVLTAGHSVATQPYCQTVLEVNCGTAKNKKKKSSKHISLIDHYDKNGAKQVTGSLPQTRPVNTGLIMNSFMKVLYLQSVK